MRVGWLGLGAMGAPMATCLARSGHSVNAYDIAQTGTVVVIMATVGPGAVAAAADRLAASGVAVVDAPVAGRCCARAPGRPSCSTTAVRGWSKANSTRYKARWTSS
jgi:3-hydroxyisobutyrate dehydrogenase-like beta-hydroxyacid dehydrogenase